MFLTEIQRSVQRHLQAQSFFAESPTIPVIAQNDTDLLAKLNAATLSPGLCVLVAPVTGKFGLAETKSPFYDGAMFTCRVRENIPVNRATDGTRQPADYVCEIIAALLKNHQPLSEDGQRLCGGGILIMSVDTGTDEKGINAWDVTFSVSGGSVSHAPVRREFTEASNSIT